MPHRCGLRIVANSPRHARPDVRRPRARPGDGGYAGEAAGHPGQREGDDDPEAAPPLDEVAEQRPGRTAGEAAEFDCRIPHRFGAAGRGPVDVLSLFGKSGERIHLRTGGGGGGRRT